jgi:hypothetical protein
VVIKWNQVKCPDIKILNGIALSALSSRRFLLIFQESRRTICLPQLKVRFHHYIFGTNLLTNSLTKLHRKQMSHIFVIFVSQKFVANQIGLPQTHSGDFVRKFVSKFVANM